MTIIKSVLTGDLLEQVLSLVSSGQFTAAFDAIKAAIIAVISPSSAPAVTPDLLNAQAVKAVSDSLAASKAKV